MRHQERKISKSQGIFTQKKKKSQQSKGNISNAQNLFSTNLNKFEISYKNKLSILNLINNIIIQEEPKLNNLPNLNNQIVFNHYKVWLPINFPKIKKLNLNIKIDF